MEQNPAKRSASNIDESDTIANQRNLLLAYAARKGLADHQIIEYADDGHSGTNFRRPGFEQLMRDAGKGKISTVIVKDFSRMGRDYIGVGNCLETMFPSMGIRVISVNDGWDSDEHPGHTLGLDTSFRTILYDMYSRDLSRKLKSSNAVRSKKGIYSTSLTPYGYQKDPADKHNLVIDVAEAAVVRRIFNMFRSGIPVSEIAKTLTAEHVETPSRRNNKLGQSKAAADTWDASVILRLLKNEFYTGTVILNRMESVYGEGRTVIKDRSEWLFFHDRHEPIVSREEFDEAQKKIRLHTGTRDIGAGKGYPIKCGHCGRAIISTTTYENIMVCRKQESDPNAVCGDIKIRRDVLQQCISDLVRQQAQVFVEWCDLEDQMLAKDKSLSHQLGNVRRVQTMLKNKRLGLYESFKDGDIDKDEFLARKSESLEKEEALLEEEQKIIAEIEAKKVKTEEIRRMIEELQEYGRMRTIDPTAARELIGDIRVFNDGHLSVRWNFQDEYPELFQKIHAVEEGRCDIHDEVKALVYSSDLRYVERENNGIRNRGIALGYCTDVLGYNGDEIRCYYDGHDEHELFYRRDYMRMMAAARSGRYEVIVIKDFGELYLSKNELHNLLYWYIPRLPCRLISLADEYDSSAEGETSDPDRIFEKYKGIRRSDLLRFHKQERRIGTREANPPKIPRCAMLYGYYSDDSGCYADTEILRAVKTIYWDIIAGRKPGKIFREFNEKGIPTQNEFFAEHGMKYWPEKNHEWNLEKLDKVMKNRRYMTECRYSELCEQLGRHCERRPIITKKDFEKANRIYVYRDR